MEDNTRIEIRRWRTRIFATVWITYFAYYLCRYNMTVAKTPLCDAFGWSAGTFGKVFSALTIFYAIGQFVNGQLGDRFGTRIISSVGALGSVAMNLCVFVVVMTVSPHATHGDGVLTSLIIFWGANGFFQAMGWAPMVRVMAHWFPAATRGKTMGWLGTCYQFGAAVSVFLATFLTGYYVQRFGGDWRMVFLVPSLVFGAIGMAFFLLIRNDPADVGLPPVDAGESGAEAAAETRPRTIVQNVIATLANPYLWVVAGTFFMLDVNRYGFVNWMPAYIDKHAVKETSALMANFKKVMTLCIHPLAGSVGAVVAGWATDRFFGGRRAPVIAILLTLLGLFSFAFTCVNPNHTALVVVIVALVGFCTYGPHILMVGHAAQDFGKKAGAAGAAGFIDAMGYIGATLAGWGAGALIDVKGYAFAFRIFGSAGILGAALVCIIWKAGPHIHEKPEGTQP